MARYLYRDTITNFLKSSDDAIFGAIVNNSENSEESIQQRNAWRDEIKILKTALSGIGDGVIAFEYTIPRIGKRADVILICSGVVYLLEFKVGEREYKKHAIDQVVDYALDLKNFHKESLNKKIVPILIATHAENRKNEIKISEDLISEPILCNEQTLADFLRLHIQGDIITDEEDAWLESPYSPTPTIIEAAQYIYRNKSVKEISRNDAGAHNLTTTTEAIKDIIKKSKEKSCRSICFITGVPGAGKTLAGLNIANETQFFDEDEHAVFLSGNQPLVSVLQEALARDAINNFNINKKEAERRTKSYIQIIHHFRDDAVLTAEPPHEKVVIFDEAQRSWDTKQLSKFMQRKKETSNFLMSEPESLIEYMNRHQDWATIICLVGGGQEINTGEAGLMAWFEAIVAKYPQWDVYMSSMVEGAEYLGKENYTKILRTIPNLYIDDKLHLPTSTRSFRSEHLSAFIQNVLDVRIERARQSFEALSENYPIYITRDLNIAKQWVKKKARGTERYGIVASSKAGRLRRFGVSVADKIKTVAWFLNDEEDVRSSYALEQCATEFEVQGLELDWTIVCWDADLRFNGQKFEHYAFLGSRWTKVNKEENVKYLINSYRVILTRARQGMIIYVPIGDQNDKTTSPNFYDQTYEYLRQFGLKEI